MTRLKYKKYTQGRQRARGKKENPLRQTTWNGPYLYEMKFLFQGRKRNLVVRLEKRMLMDLTTAYMKAAEDGAPWRRTMWGCAMTTLRAL
jgi:hypothetical protein